MIEFIEKYRKPVIIFLWGMIAGMAICLGIAENVAQAAEVKALIEYDHTSDLMRGKAPWARDVPEPYQDYIGAGATIVFGPHFEIDISHGLKLFTGSIRTTGKWETGSKLTVRMYPGKHKS